MLYANRAARNDCMSPSVPVWCPLAPGPVPLPGARCWFSSLAPSSTSASQDPSAGSAFPSPQTHHLPEREGELRHQCSVFSQNIHTPHTHTPHPTHTPYTSHSTHTYLTLHTHCILHTHTPCTPHTMYIYTYTTPHPTHTSHTHTADTPHTLQTHISLSTHTSS